MTCFLLLIVIIYEACQTRLCLEFHFCSHLCEGSLSQTNGLNPNTPPPLLRNHQFRSSPYFFYFCFPIGGKIRRWWEKMLTDRKTYGFGDRLQCTLWESGNKLYSDRAYSFPACGFWHAPLAIISCPLDRDRTSRIQTEIMWLIYRCHFKVIKSRIDTTYGTLFGIEKCKTLFWEIN